MSAFIEMLTRSNSEIKKDRAERLGKITKNAAESAITGISDEILKVEDKLDSQLDVSTSNDANTINRIDEWDAEEFIHERIDLEVKLKNLELNLEAAKKVKSDLFGEEQGDSDES